MSREILKPITAKTGIIQVQSSKMRHAEATEYRCLHRRSWCIGALVLSSWEIDARDHVQCFKFGQFTERVDLFGLIRRTIRRGPTFRFGN